jgi:hypothetical protein
LKIPTVDGALDAEPAHGHYVFAQAKAAVPGTPILVLTGSPAEDFIPAMLGASQQIDIWSEGRAVGTVDFLKKYKLEECPLKLKPMISAIHRLSEVELNRGGTELTPQEERLLRIFSKKFDGTHCAINQLGGGLSGAKVMRVKVKSSSGAVVHDAVAKLGSREDIRDEAERFDIMVSRLVPSATPRKLATLEYGAGARAGVFYGLAAGFEASAFDLAAYQNGRARGAVLGIETATSRWNDGVPQSRIPVGDVRRRVLSENHFRQCEICFR